MSATNNSIYAGLTAGQRAQAEALIQDGIDFLNSNPNVFVDEEDCAKHLLETYTTIEPKELALECARIAMLRVLSAYQKECAAANAPTAAQAVTEPTAQAAYEGFYAVAMRAVQRGQRPLPIKPGAKKPLIPWRGSSIDTASKPEWPAIAQEWVELHAKRFPNASCCVIAKPNEYLFLDEDESARFRKGYEEFSGLPFPRTFTTESRPDHRQSHWQQTDSSRAFGNQAQPNLGFLSVRQTNLYVLSEGSQHPKGGFYRIVDDTPAIPMPDKMVEYLLKLKADKKAEKHEKQKISEQAPTAPTAMTAKTGEPNPVGGPGQPVGSTGAITEGSRNTLLASLAGTAHAEFRLNADELFRFLCRINLERCSPALDTSEVRTIADSVGRYSLPGEVLVAGQPCITDAIKEQFISGQIAGRPDEQQLAGQIDEPDHQSWQARVTNWLAEGVSQEEIGERFLKEVGATAQTTKTQVKVAEALEALLEDDPIKQIPAFDPSVMTGICQRIVELAIRNTTLLPQYAFLAAKTLVGMLASSKFILFGDVDATPRFYSVFIGDSGAGKGCAYKRVLEIFQIGFSTSRTSRADMKIINSADSGAGLKDCFFEAGEPSNTPVLMYIDELRTLGNKSAENRNPDIMDTIYELADCTSVSRILSKRGGKGSEITNENAQLSLIACVQNKDVIARALAGRNDMGSPFATFRVKQQFLSWKSRPDGSRRGEAASYAAS